MLRASDSVKDNLMETKAGLGSKLLDATGLKVITNPSILFILVSVLNVVWFYTGSSR